MPFEKLSQCLFQFLPIHLPFNVFHTISFVWLHNGNTLNSGGFKKDSNIISLQLNLIPSKQTKLL